MANDAVRRIMAEVKEISALNNQPSTFFHALPLESDLFEWHFTVRGPPDTPFEHGVYHGRILLPAEYPLKAPEIILLTPNGRFEVGKRICLSVTAHHQETWQPSWGIRTILTALVGFMPSKAEGVGALDFPDEDRRGLARKSHGFRCARCGAVPVEQLPPREVTAASDGEKSEPSERSERGREVREGGGDDSTTVGESSTTTGESVGGGVPSVSAETLQSMNRGESAEEPRREVEAEAEVETERVEREGGEVENVQVEEDVIEPEVPLREETRRREGVQERIGEEEGEGEEVKEKELLYVAYAIVALMLAVVIRRVLKMLTD